MNGSRGFAGQIFSYGNLSHLLLDRRVRYELARVMRERLKTDSILGACVVQLDFPHFVGWESTDLAQNYEESELEPFRPHRSCTGLRVKSSVQARVPQTRSITILGVVKTDRRGIRYVVSGLYAGEDYGVLMGDITQRTGRVFFSSANHWGHR